MILQKINEIEKGCKKIVNRGNCKKVCGSVRNHRYLGYKKGDIFLCPICQAKLSAIKETAKLMIDDEINRIDTVLELVRTRNLNRMELVATYVDRLNLLQKQRSELNG